MGSANSKPNKNDALRLCRERKRFIKQAIDSRYALAASHVSYVQSLREIGVSLRRYAEAEILMESSLSTSAATELDKTPSRSWYPSPSPSHLADAPDSPIHDENPNPNPNPRPRHISPPMADLRYMKAGTSSAVTVVVNPDNGGSGVVEDDTLVLPNPPPPPFRIDNTSWDYFDSTEDCESFRFVGHDEWVEKSSDGVRGWEKFKGENEDRKFAKSGPERNAEFRQRAMNSKPDSSSNQIDNRGQLVGMRNSDVGHGEGLACNASLETEVCDDREDPSEFITHRAKDFLSSIKDIEHRFFRASESGREVSRMLEATKIRVGFVESKGLSSTAFLAELLCCRRKTALVSQEPGNQGTKVITWKRTTSSRSSSSRNLLNAASKDDGDGSRNDFGEELCMISGSHSSTLDRLYAWERKLYDEVKASESIRKEYDRKCEQLRNQFAKDCSTQVIDKTRSVVKDLHSRIRVAIQSVDSISKRIERIRDEELQPQLAELIQGLTWMWKSMLECHHAQYITISLAYHTRSSSVAHHGDSHGQILSQLEEDVECFGLSFADWVNSLTFYMDALNGWLQHCILLPQERSKRRRPWSPTRVLAPPIFVLCRDWSAGIKSLPSDELSQAIKAFLYDLRHLMDRHGQRLPKNDEPEDERDEKINGDDASSSLLCVHSGLTKVLDRLNKFSEASLKMYEDVRQKSEAARIAYQNHFRPARF